MKPSAILSGNRVINWKVRDLLTIEKYDPNFAISIGIRKDGDDIFEFPKQEDLVWLYRSW